MNTNEDNNENIFSSVLDNTLSTIDSIPIPPVVKKNLLKSINNLVTAAVDVPVAWLESKAKKIRTQSDALNKVIESTGISASLEVNNDPDLIQRSVNHYTSRIFKEQKNRETIAQKAIKEIEANQHSQDAKSEIDTDWLEAFQKIAETKSNEDIQLFLAKVLAGEIVTPGSFSLRTIHTLSLLDQKSAGLFQKLCNISFELADIEAFIISDPIGEPENNAFELLGLSYVNLLALQDSGLITGTLAISRGYIGDIYNFPIKIGGSILKFEITEETKEIKGRVSTINFTNTGLELRKVLHLSSNPTYIQKFIKWSQDKYKVKFIQ